MKIVVFLRIFHQQNIGIGGQSTRESHALLHAAGEFVGELRSPGTEFDDIENGRRLAHALILADLPDLERHRDIVQHRTGGISAKF